MVDVVLTINDAKVEYFKERLFVIFPKPEGRTDLQHFKFIIKDLLLKEMDVGNELFQSQSHDPFDRELFD